MSRASDLIKGLNEDSSLSLEFDKLVNDLDQISSAYKNFSELLPNGFDDVSNEVYHCLDDLSSIVIRLEAARKRFMAKTSLSSVQVNDE